MGLKVGPSVTLPGLQGSHIPQGLSQSGMRTTFASSSLSDLHLYAIIVNLTRFAIERKCGGILRPEWYPHTLAQSGCYPVCRVRLPLLAEWINWLTAVFFSLRSAEINLFYKELKSMRGVSFRYCCVLETSPRLDWLVFLTCNSIFRPAFESPPCPSPLLNFPTTIDWLLLT